MISAPLIHYKTYNAFKQDLSIIPEQSVVFIKETKQIYTHGIFYDQSVSLITLNSSKPSSDQTAYSSLKSDKIFLRKDKEDSTEYLMSFFGGLYAGRYEKNKNGGKIDYQGNIEGRNCLLRGLLTVNNNIIAGYNIQSDNYKSGMSGYTILKYNQSGHSYLEVDELYVRLKAYFESLEIKKVSYIGGSFVVSPAGAKIANVEVIYDNIVTDIDNDYIYDINNSFLSTGTSSSIIGYRCYLQVDDGETEVENEFRINDLVQCKTFNIKEGIYENVSNSYYWRKVIGIGNDYIDLSDTDKDLSSTIPQKGDTIITLGNSEDVERQNAIILTAFGEGSPSFIQYAKINSYSLENKEVTKISPYGNIFTGDFRLTNGDDLSNAIEDAIKDASEAMNRLDKWANDSYISPDEKGELKTEIIRIDKDAEEFEDSFKKYDLDWGEDYGQNYVNAYNDYRSKLVELSSNEEEIYPIGNLRELQENYYNCRTIIVIKITEAEKGYVDSTKDNLISYVNSEIIATKDEFTSTYNKISTDLETFKKETNTKFEQTAEDISLKADSTVVDQLGNVVSQHSSLISQNAEKIESTVTSITTLEGELSSQIKQTADNIYLGISKKFKYNLFIDGSFERGYNNDFSSQNIPEHNDGLESNPIVISGGKFGDYCLQVKQWGEGDSYFYINQRVPVESNTTYTIVFWHRDFGVEGTSSSYVEESYKSGDNYLVASNDYLRTTHSTTWHIEVIQITTRSNTEYLRLRFGRNGTGYSWSEFDGIMIFKGTKEYQSEEGGEIVTRKNYPEDSFIDNELNEDSLYDTGIDIRNKKITVTADTFEIKNNNGEVTAKVNNDGVLETNGGIFNNVTVNGSLRQPWVFLEYALFETTEEGELIYKYRNKNNGQWYDGGKYDNIMFDSLTKYGTVVTNTSNTFGNGGKLNNVQLPNGSTYLINMGYVQNTRSETELDPLCEWLYGDSDDIGRVVTLIHLPNDADYDDFYNLDSSYYLVIQAPTLQSGNNAKLFRFYDPDVTSGTAGRQNDKIVLHNEIVELYGYGVDNVFRGWIIKNRTKFNT